MTTETEYEAHIRAATTLIQCDERKRLPQEKLREFASHCVEANRLRPESAEPYVLVATMSLHQGDPELARASGDTQNRPMRDG